MGLTQTGFQIDVLSSTCNWPVLMRRQSYWLGGIDPSTILVPGLRLWYRTIVSVRPRTITQAPTPFNVLVGRMRTKYELVLSYHIFILGP